MNKAVRGEGGFGSTGVGAVRQAAFKSALDGDAAEVRSTDETILDVIYRCRGGGKQFVDDKPLSEEQKRRLEKLSQREERRINAAKELRELTAADPDSWRRSHDPERWHRLFSKEAFKTVRKEDALRNKAQRRLEHLTDYRHTGVHRVPCGNEVGKKLEIEMEFVVPSVKIKEYKISSLNL
jgi:hypothetical protein